MILYPQILSNHPNGIHIRIKSITIVISTIYKLHFLLDYPHRSDTLFPYPHLQNQCINIFLHFLLACETIFDNKVDFKLTYA
jgi:hypothetical protein